MSMYLFYALLTLKDKLKNSCFVYYNDIVFVHTLYKLNQFCLKRFTLFEYLKSDKKTKFRKFQSKTFFELLIFRLEL